jgi:hypothetical protein
MSYPREVSIRIKPNLQVICFHTDGEGNAIADGLLDDEIFNGIEKSAHDELKLLTESYKAMCLKLADRLSHLPHASLFERNDTIKLIVEARRALGEY